MKHTPESVKETVEAMRCVARHFWNYPEVDRATTMLSDLLAENERMREALQTIEAMLPNRPTYMRLKDRARAALTPESKE